MFGFKISRYAIVSMIACASLQADQVTWNVMPETQSVLIQDARWHQLSSKEKSIMLEIVATNIYGQKNTAAQLLQDDDIATQKLSSLYDLLAFAVKNNNKTLLFFLLSHGVNVTDQAVNALSEYQMEKFFEFGLSPNHRLSNGDTLLINAMKHKKWDIARALLKAQAEVTLTDASGKKAFDYVTMSDINWHFENDTNLYKHLTCLQKLKALRPHTDTILCLTFLAAASYGFYKLVNE
ncbi:MAG TPA: ankyrin repeat domain-containing protein [Candidatus Saccharimonadales bacterium]|nr:ankyrin repeat domain-containing protein [Candidatus Saccharimonadales bacterium]